jgi:iron complex transport system substrate-binding protein
VSLEDVERAISARFATAPTVVALEPNSLADVWADIRRVADGCGVANSEVSLVSSLQERLSAIAKKASASARRPRIACIEWTDPLMVAGNWVPELVELAGGINLFGNSGQHSPSLPWEEFVAVDPDVIAVMPCGFDLPRTRTELHALVSRSDWPSLRAVREGLVYVTDGNQYFNRPGPRLVESAQILAEILHPDLFPPQLEGKGWQRVSTR